MATRNCAQVLVRRIRFTLRTFLVVVVLVGASSGLIAGRILYIVHVLDCVPEIEKHGVQVVSNFHTRYGLFALDKRGNRIEFLEWTLADPEYISVLQHDPASSDKLMEMLATLGTVKEVNAAHVSVSGLRKIAAMPNLESLYLRDSAVDDDAITILARFPKLQQLGLVNSPVSDHGLCRLAQMKTLKELYLQKTNVTESGVAALRTCRPDMKVEVALSNLTECGSELAERDSRQYYASAEPLCCGFDHTYQ